MELGGNVRVGVNAIIESEREILAVKFDDESGEHYHLPGGGVMPGETLPEALKSEVEEETTAAIEVGSLQLIHEYNPKEQGGEYGEIHKLTCIFSGALRPDSNPSFPTDPDPHQVAVESLDTETIDQEPLLPTLGTAWSDVISGDIPDLYVRDTLIWANRFQQSFARQAAGFIQFGLMDSIDGGRRTGSSLQSGRILLGHGA